MTIVTTEPVGPGAIDSIKLILGEHYGSIGICCKCQLFYDRSVMLNGTCPQCLLNNKDFDPVNKPKHYNTHPSGVECIQVTEHMSFNIGNAIKYLWRARDKGSQKEDLEKAIWYVNREIKRLGL